MGLKDISDSVGTLSGGLNVKSRKSKGFVL